MRRPLFITACVASLLLFVATIFAWVRSYQVNEYFAWTTQGESVNEAIASLGGKVPEVRLRHSRLPGPVSGMRHTDRVVLPLTFSAFK